MFRSQCSVGGFPTKQFKIVVKYYSPTRGCLLVFDLEVPGTLNEQGSSTYRTFLFVPLLLWGGGEEQGTGMLEDHWHV